MKQRGVVAAEERGQEKYECFAVKILLPSQKQENSRLGKCQISLTKMNLGPAVDELLGEVEIKYFDHFSGKILLSVSQNLEHRTNIMIDCLSKAL